MKTNKTKPNAAQVQWMKDIAEFIQDNGLDILYPGYEGRTDFQLHHVLGRSAKHNKIAIGHWFIIPVPIELHDVGSNHPDNVTHFKRNFTERFGSQSELFKELIGGMFECGYKTPNDEVYHAIMDTGA